MKSERPYRWIVLILWPLLGGAWGAWILFRGPYSRLSHMNADTLAPAVVGAFVVCFSFFALIAGVVICTLIGRIVEWIRWRFGISLIAAIAVASLINVLTLWQISYFLQAKYPGMRAESPTKKHRRNVPGKFLPADKGSYRSSCLDPPPADTKERAIWDAECL